VSMNIECVGESRSQTHSHMQKQITCWRDSQVCCHISHLITQTRFFKKEV